MGPMRVCPCVIQVGPTSDPFYVFQLKPTSLPCPCWSQLGPIFIFIWDLHGHSHLGILMLVPLGTHLYFHMGFIWVLLLWHVHAGPNWDPHLISPGTQLGIPTWAFPYNSICIPDGINCFDFFFLNILESNI